MTVDVLVSAPIYTISGTGPYALGHGYSHDEEIVAWVRDSGVDTALSNPDDFSVSPIGSADNGDVSLTSAAAAAHDGKQLVLRRATLAEQGWIADTTRERSLSAQLDRNTRAIQDLKEVAARCLKTAAGLQGSIAVHPTAGRVLAWDETARLSVGPAVVDLDAAVAAKALVDQALLDFPNVGMSLTATPFASRAIAEAATIPAPAVKISVMAPSGPVLDYFRDAAGTALTTADGQNWSPAGDAYPDHWAENTTPGATDMGAAINAMIAHTAPLKATGFLQGGQVYYTSVQIRVDATHTRIKGDGAADTKPQIRTAAEDKAVYFAPTDPDNSVGTIIASISFENFILYRTSDGSTGSGFHGEQAVNVEFRDVAAWGFKWGFKLLGCKNINYFNITGAPVNFTGASESAMVYIGHLILDNGSELAGFTHRFKDGLLSGSSAAIYEAGIQIAHNDFTQIEGIYMGFNQRDLLLQPSSDTARVINTMLMGCYFDGGTVPSNQIAIDIDGNGNNGTVEYVILDGGIIGQMRQGIVVRSDANLDLLRCDSVDFHNCVEEMILSATTSDADIQINGCNFWNWSRLGSGANGTDYAINVANGRGLYVNNCHFRAFQNPTPAISATNLDALHICGNRGENLSATYAQSGNAKVVIEGNSSNLDWFDTTSEYEGAWSPELEFGGASTGVTYTARTGFWKRDRNHIFFSIYLELSSKGSAAGDATISLPFTPKLSRNTVGDAPLLTGVPASTGRAGYVAYIAGGTANISLRYMTDAGGSSIMQETDFSDASIIALSGRFDL